jgi:tetratricopeptide (TPR) repeat protein
MRWMALVLLFALAAPVRAADPPVAPGFAQDGEDPPVVLTPAKDRTEVEQDRLTAESMFTHARLLYQRDKFDSALRRYERAFRYDPQAVAILGEIVSLAFELERNEEAARYAVIAAEKDPRDPVLLRRLAMHLTEQQEYARALQLYKKSFDLQKDAGDDVTTILLHMEIGRLNFLLEQYQPASESLLRVRDAIADPKKFGLSDELYKIVLGNAHATYALLAETFLQAGKYADAEAMFHKAHEAKADEATLAYNVARLRAKQKRTDEALMQLAAYFAAKSDTAGVEAYDLLEELLQAKHADKQVAQTKLLERLNELRTAEPKNTALGFAVAKAMHAADQDDKAIEVLTKSLDEDATAESATLLVKLLRERGKTGEMLTALGKSLGKSAALSSLDDEAAKLIADEAAIKNLVAEAQRRKAAMPSTLTAGEALAVALLSVRAKQFDAADEFFAVVLEKPVSGKRALPKAEAVLTWGLELFQAEQFDRAVEVFQNALDKKLASSREDAVYYFLASAQEMQGKTDDAIATIDKTIKGDKPAARMLGRKAWILYHAKRYAEAEKYYRELLTKWDSDHKTAGNREIMREARMVLSNIGVQTNRRTEGMEWLEQVLDEFPEDVGAMNDLGYLWSEDAVHLHRALTMLQKAVSIEPENHAYRDSLGWIYYQLGQYPEAVRELEKAADVKEPDGVILDHLGDAYLKVNALGKAADAWTRAAAAFKKERDATREKATLDKIGKHTSM